MSILHGEHLVFRFIFFGQFLYIFFLLTEISSKYDNESKINSWNKFCIPLLKKCWMVDVMFWCSYPLTYYVCFSKIFALHKFSIYSSVYRSRPCLFNWNIFHSSISVMSPKQKMLHQLIWHHPIPLLVAREEKLVSLHLQ